MSKTLRLGVCLKSAAKSTGRALLVASRSRCVRESTACRQDLSTRRAVWVALSKPESDTNWRIRSRLSASSSIGASIGHLHIHMTTLHTLLTRVTTPARCSQALHATHACARYDRVCSCMAKIFWSHTHLQRIALIIQTRRWQQKTLAMLIHTVDWTTRT